MNYSDIEEKYNHHAHILGCIAMSTGEGIEGNVYTGHLEKGMFSVYHPAKSRRINLFTVSRYQSCILEIGFNAGHSCLVFLLSNPSSVIYCLDICQHAYVKLCFTYLQKVFGEDRLILIEGDSTKTLKDYKFPVNRKPTLFHIDGCHYIEYASQDMQNCYTLAESGDVLVLDDTNLPLIKALWDEYINSNKIVPYVLCNLVPQECCFHEVGMKV